jgi:hypothetical protein
MSIIKSILNFLNRKDSSDQIAPEGYCPNCWGKQEYGGQFYEAIKNEGVDIHQTNPQKGWIQDYAEKNLSGIRLKPADEGKVCPKCKVTYRPTK